jgi:hypothetical protein
MQPLPLGRAEYILGKLHYLTVFNHAPIAVGAVRELCFEIQRLQKENAELHEAAMQRMSDGNVV